MSGIPKPLDLQAIKAQAARVEQETVGLKETVASAEERRCPFLKTEQDPEKEDSPEVDAVCDIRTQRFSDLPPFGPMTLEICELCLRAKALDAQEAMASAQLEVLNAAQYPGPDEGDSEESAEGKHPPMYR